jgi:hypothetical protein
MKVLVNVQTKMKMKMKKAIEPNTKMNMSLQISMNVKIEVNTMPQMERRRCLFTGRPGDQMKAEVQERALFDDAPEDLPRRNVKAITPQVVPADVDQPDEAALPAARNGKCACKQAAIELRVVLLAGGFPPVLPVR